MRISDWSSDVCSSDLNVQLVASFAIGFDPDKAVIDVQNRVQAALPLLPEEVRRQGLTVRKLNATAVSYVTIDSPDGRYDSGFISNYALVNIVDELRRIPGVGSVDSFGMKEYAIRIWLTLARLAYKSAECHVGQKWVSTSITGLSTYI